MAKKADIVKIAAATLLELCDEHGVPNNFAPHEFNMASHRMFLGLYADDIAAEAMRQRPGLGIDYQKNGGFDRETQESSYAWYSVWDATTPPET